MARARMALARWRRSVMGWRSSGVPGDVPAPRMASTRRERERERRQCSRFGRRPAAIRYRYRPRDRARFGALEVSASTFRAKRPVLGMDVESCSCASARAIIERICFGDGPGNRNQGLAFDRKWVEYQSKFTRIPTHAAGLPATRVARVAGWGIAEDQTPARSRSMAERTKSASSRGRAPMKGIENA